MLRIPGLQAGLAAAVLATTWRWQPVSTAAEISGQRRRRLVLHTCCFIVWGGRTLVVGDGGRCRGGGGGGQRSGGDAAVTSQPLSRLRRRRTHPRGVVAVVGQRYGLLAVDLEVLPE